MGWNSKFNPMPLYLKLRELCHVSQEMLFYIFSLVPVPCCGQEKKRNLALEMKALSQHEEVSAGEDGG
jgi:hypothetical protein